MKTTCRATGLQTADLLIATGAALLDGVLIVTDGTNAATLTVYDNTAASGKKLFQATVAGASNSGHFDWTSPVKAEIGLFADVSGTGASYIVYHG